VLRVALPAASQKSPPGNGGPAKSSDTVKALLDRLRADPARLRLERLERLQDLTAALSAAATPGDVARLIFDRGLGLVGARAVTLFWERAAGELELVHGLGLSDEFVHRYRKIGTDAALPSAEAYRTGEPVWLPTLEAMRARFPAVAALAEAEGDVASAAIPLVVDRSRGALELRFDAERVFDEEEREFVLAVARQCAQALERARLYEAQRRLADRLGALQSATGALSAALLPAEVAAVLFRGLLGLGAREGAIFYGTSDDRLELLFGHGDAPGLRERLAELPLGARAPHTDAFAQGAPIWLDDPAAIRAAYPELESGRARRGEGAWVAVPLRMEDRSVGVLALTFPEGLHVDEEDRSFVLALAQQAAQALERARLFEGQRRLTERLTQIHSTAAALSGAGGGGGGVEAALRRLAVLGAVAADLHAIERPERLILVARHGPPGPAADETVPLDAPRPAAEVVRTGKALWLESPDDIAGRFPELEDQHGARGEGAWAVVPLLAGGETLGALTVGFPSPRRFQTDEKAFVRMLAIPCAQALERARLYEAASRHRAEAEWNAAMLDAALAAAPVGIALLDRDMRFLRVNAHLAELAGRAPDALLGRALAETVQGVPGAALVDAARRVLETGATEEFAIEGEAPASPGVARRWIATCYPVRVGGDVVAAGVVVRDASGSAA
jgi:GAF domain-containing protein